MVKMTEEQRAKIAEDARLQWRVPFIRAQLSAPNFGQKMRPDVRKKLRAELKRLRSSESYLLAMQKISENFRQQSQKTSL